MHAIHLAQLASSLTFAGNALGKASTQSLGDAAHAYWLAHRFRCDAWHQRISTHRSAIEFCGTSRRTRLWNEILPTLSEILISEPLSRTLACLALLLEQRGHDADWGPLAHSALVNHVEARNRCLNLMVFGHGLPVEKAVSLNRLRRLLEFYADQLLAALPKHASSEHFAFEPEHVTKAQQTFSHYSIDGRFRAMRVHALSASLASLLRFEHDHRSANPRLNSSIAEASLAILPAKVFDSFGLLSGGLHEMLQNPPVDRAITANDPGAPLAAPFDVLMKLNQRSDRTGLRKGRRS